MGSLIKSFNKTNLDLTDSGPSGNFNMADTITSYPAIATGTPTDQANPSSPRNFIQTFNPQYTYLELTKNKYSPLLHFGKDSSNDGGTDETYSILDITNLDISKPGVDGGIPYKQIKDPTVYPILAQGKASISGYYPATGSDANKFNQNFSPTYTYLDYIKK